MELEDSAPLGLAQGGKNGPWIGHRPGDDLAHVLVRPIGGVRSPAVGNKAVEIEHEGPQFCARLRFWATVLVVWNSNQITRDQAPPLALADFLLALPGAQ